MTSRADDVILALTTLWAATPALEGVQVHDGPQVNSDPSPEWLFVGYDGAEGTEYAEGATVEQEADDSDGQQQLEVSSLLNSSQKKKKKPGGL